MAARDGVAAPAASNHSADGSRTIGSDIRLAVRDIGEARAFYERIFKTEDALESEDCVRLQIDGQYLFCSRQREMGTRGRVPAIFRFGSGGFEPVRQRIALQGGHWRSALKALRRSGIPHTVYAADPPVAHTPRGSCIALLDPSGNPLELVSVSGQLSWHRRWFVRALNITAALALVLLIIYVIWGPAEPITDVVGTHTNFRFWHFRIR